MSRRPIWLYCRYVFDASISPPRVCGKPLLRRAHAKGVGYVCSGCRALYTVPENEGWKLLHRTPLRWDLKAKADAEKPVDYDVHEQLDGRIVLRIGDGAVTLTPNQAKHLADSLDGAARWGQEWLDLASGRFDWVVTSTGIGRYSVGRDGHSVTVLPTVIRKDNICTICAAKQQPGAPMWKPETSKWRLPASMRFCDGCITSLSVVTAMPGAMAGLPS